MKVFVNEHAGGVFPGAGPARAPLEFHRRLPGYEATPLIEAPAIAERLSLGEVWIKDESSRLGLPAFKVLGASWAVYRALEAHTGGLGEWSAWDELAARLATRRPPALAAATDGNHGRAVARMARLLGLGARIFVPAGTARARIEAIESEGASCEVVDGTYDDAVARSAEEAGAGCLVISDTSWPGYSDVPRWVIDGYSTIFWELEDELGRRGIGSPEVVAVPLGVGALGAAAARHWRRPGALTGTALVGVEPEQAACVLESLRAGEIVTVPGPHDSIMAGLNCGTPSPVAWPFVSGGFDVVTSVEDERAEEAMRLLAADGVVAGESGAAGLAGLLALLEDPQGEPARAAAGLSGAARVLLLVTESATDPESYQRIVGRAPAS